MLLCVSDEFRDKYININREASSTTFGAETYYGQDFIWMNKSNDVVVFDLPYFTGEKSNKDDFKIIKSDYTRYNNLMRALRLLKEMKSDMEESSVMPLVISKQYTAISMEPGAKVLDMLSKKFYYLTKRCIGRNYLCPKHKSKKNQWKRLFGSRQINSGQRRAVGIQTCRFKSYLLKIRKR